MRNELLKTIVCGFLDAVCIVIGAVIAIPFGIFLTCYFMSGKLKGKTITIESDNESHI